MDHLGRRGSSQGRGPQSSLLMSQVFKGLCPGTDSSFLHIAAALGHESVIEILTEVCHKNFADSQGKSPAAIAAIAAICHQDHCCPYLLPSSFDVLAKDGSWTLKNFRKENVVENLLLTCAEHGGIEALGCLINRISSGNILYREALDSAIFHACKGGRCDNGRVLVAAGGDPDVYVKFVGSYFPSKEISSSLERALQLGDPSVIHNLLLVGADPAARQDHPTVLDIIRRCRGNFQMTQECLKLLIPSNKATRVARAQRTILDTMIAEASTWYDPSHSMVDQCLP